MGAPAHANKVRALDMDSTKEELRRALKEENQHLMQQVELVRLRLEDASEFRHQVIEAPTPSVQEIRELEKKLQKMSVAPQESLLDIMQRLTEAASPVSSPKSAQISAPVVPGLGSTLSPQP